MDQDIRYYLGVDVGTGSARVGVFNQNGKLLNSKSEDIKIHNPVPGFYEQSSTNIWGAVVRLVKEVTNSLDKSKIRGIAFCATCSLVAINKSGSGVSISHCGDVEWDIVMWMDHRAEKEADFINQSGHRVLDFVGGKISLEMQTPKLLWLKKHLPQRYLETEQFFDLPDFLRWKASGSLKRSICSVECKWTAIGSPEKGCVWDQTFFEGIGLEDAIPKIGSHFSFPGDCDKLGADAAKEMGLEGLEVMVGYSLIDAHSGVLGMMGCKNSSGDKMDITKRLALICGTSNCHMALSREPCMVAGVWGPYYGVILPNLHLSEGGQSAAGKLLDHVVSSHVAYPKMLTEFGGHGKILSHLENLLTSIPDAAELTSELHIWPDFHGNRSPIADPTLKGMVSGLTLSDAEMDLAIIYLATIQALAYGSRHIMTEMEKNGHSFDSLVICGGLTKSKLFLQSHSDILQLPVLVPECPEPVLLGVAISAAAAGGGSLNVEQVMKTMSGGAEVISPNKKMFRYHTKKVAVFHEMLKDQLKYKLIMNP